MSHALTVSDETYRDIETLARQRGTSPESLAETLLKERLAERRAIARQNAEWEATLDDALARAARGENKQYADSDSFFADLDAIPVEPTETGEA